MDIIERAAAYTRAFPPAVEGSGGDAATIKICRTLIKGFGLPVDTALRILGEWNSRCAPPWSEQALRAKLRSAERMAIPAGFMLGDGSERHRNAPVPASTGRPRYSFRAPREAASHAYERVSGLRMPSLSEQAQIARLRNLCPYVPVLAANLGILRVGVNRGLPAFFLIGERTLQARRMDGQKWSAPGRKPFKTDTIGKVGDAGIWWNVGPKTRRVIVTEGLVSALEILECFLRAEEETGQPTPADVGFLAVYQAGAKLTEDEAAAFRGKRVIILADRGKAGFDSAKDHRQAMREKGVRDVRAYQFTSPAEDLGGFLRESPACPPDLLRFILPYRITS